MPAVSIEECLERSKRGDLLKEHEIFRVCQVARDLFIQEGNIHDVRSPVTLCGDIHGQFSDLLELFRVSGGFPPDVSYIFMGDYVDRGNRSVEVILLLLLLKIRYPLRIFLIRGNHETRQISQVYGFYDECLKKYGNTRVWMYCCDVFDFLPIGALVDGRILCIHGGLSPQLKTIDQMRRLRRTQEIPHEGALCDLMWSDPEDLENESWSLGPRGAGYLFGRRVAMQFNQLNDLLLIARGHQLVQEGYRFMFPERSLVTVWSAPNYCYRCGNVAAVMRIDPALEFGEKSFTIFESSNDSLAESNMRSAVLSGATAEFFM